MRKDALQGTQTHRRYQRNSVKPQAVQAAQQQQTAASVIELVPCQDTETSSDPWGRRRHLKVRECGLRRGPETRTGRAETLQF